MNTQIVKFVEIVENHSATGNSYNLREVLINPAHIIYVRQDPSMKQRLDEGSLEGLDPRQTFTKIHLNRGNAGVDITVVGDVAAIQERIGLGAKQELLRG